MLATPLEGTMLETLFNLMMPVHNLLRWVVVLVAAAAVVMAWAGVLTNAKWSGPNAKVGRFFTIAFDVQVLVGILVYVASPLIRGAFNNFGAAMGVRELRFFLVEHALIMIVAAALVHIGAARGRKTNATLQPAIFYSLAVVAVIFGIDWSRPLLPGM